MTLEDENLLDALEDLGVNAATKREELAEILQNWGKNGRAKRKKHLYLGGLFLDDLGLSVPRANEFIREWARPAGYDYKRTVSELQGLSGTSSGSNGKTTTPGTTLADRPGKTENGNGASAGPEPIWKRNAGPFPGSFCKDAAECAKKIDPQNPSQVARFRSVKGQGHVLLVLDLDAPTEQTTRNVNGSETTGCLPSERLQPAWEAAQNLWEAHDWWLMKFSGRRGFHLIDQVRGRWSEDWLESKARSIVNEAGVDWGLVDENLFRRSQMIRCPNSLHLDSGLYSVLVEPGLSIQDILTKAEAYNR